MLRLTFQPLPPLHLAFEKLLAPLRRSPHLTVRPTNAPTERLLNLKKDLDIVLKTPTEIPALLGQAFFAELNSFTLSIESLTSPQSVASVFAFLARNPSIKMLDLEFDEELLNVPFLPHDSLPNLTRLGGSPEVVLAILGSPCDCPRGLEELTNVCVTPTFWAALPFMDTLTRLEFSGSVEGFEDLIRLADSLPHLSVLFLAPLKVQWDGSANDFYVSICFQRIFLPSLGLTGRAISRKWCFSSSSAARESIHCILRQNFHTRSFGATPSRSSWTSLTSISQCSTI